MRAQHLKPWRFVGLAALLLAACNLEAPERAPSKVYDPAELTALARTTLQALQTRSFSENREYCGYLGIAPDGTLSAAAPSRGSQARCFAANLPFDWWIVGHYHTHGGYDPQIQSEIPSVKDLQSTLDTGLVGYLATPGGRFWRFDPATELAEQICGVGCLGQDPNHEPDAPIETTYDFRNLAQREGRPLFGLRPLQAPS